MKSCFILILLTYSLCIKELGNSFQLDSQSITADNKNPIITNSKPSLLNIHNILEVNFSNNLEKAEKALMRRLDNTDKSPPTNSSNLIPTYRMLTLNTTIEVKPRKTNGLISEKVRYILENGSFSSISRVFSLAGSSDSLVAFKATSK